MPASRAERVERALGLGVGNPVAGDGVLLRVLEEVEAMRAERIRGIPGSLADLFLVLVASGLESDVVENALRLAEEIDVDPAVLTVHVVVGVEEPTEQRRGTADVVLHPDVSELTRLAGALGEGSVVLAIDHDSPPLLAEDGLSNAGEKRRCLRFQRHSSTYNRFMVTSFWLGSALHEPTLLRRRTTAGGSQTSDIVAGQVALEEQHRGDALDSSSIGGDEILRFLAD